MASDPTHFDPYYKWLGIPPEDQPANHYRLLGIQQFEQDPEVIAAAADRQMAHVKTYAIGKEGERAQNLLDELAKAKICLLNPRKKQAYDLEIEKAIGSPPRADHGHSWHDPPSGMRGFGPSTLPGIATPGTQGQPIGWHSKTPA